MDDEARQTLDTSARQTLEDVLRAYLHKEKEEGGDWCILVFMHIYIQLQRTEKHKCPPKNILQIPEKLLEITHVL